MAPAETNVAALIGTGVVRDFSRDEKIQILDCNVVKSQANPHCAFNSFLSRVIRAWVLFMS